MAWIPINKLEEMSAKGVLSIALRDQEVNSRLRFIDQMVGSLYPGILKTEAEKIGRLPAVPNTVFTALRDDTLREG